MHHAILQKPLNLTNFPETSFAQERCHLPDFPIKDNNSRTRPRPRVAYLDHSGAVSLMNPIKPRMIKIKAAYFKICLFISTF